MLRLTGLLGSWALFVLGFGLASMAVAGEWINLKDARKLRRYVVIEKLLGERLAGRSAELRRARTRSESSLSLVRAKMTTASRTIDRTKGKVVLPSDGDYVEMARKNGMNVIRLGPGQSIDADTGLAARRTGGGVWKWIGQSAGSRRVLTVENNTVVEIADGNKRELPSGALIRAGDTIVIPPAGSPQGRFDQIPSETDPALEKPAGKLADPAPPTETRGMRLREKGESIFGGR